MYSYSVTYREEGHNSLVSHLISHHQKLAPGASAAQLQLVKAAIEQQNNHGGRRVIALIDVVLEEWRSPANPPGPEGYDKEYIVDLGPGHDMRIEPAHFNGFTWYAKFSKKYVTPHQWLLKTPIISPSESGGL